MVSENDLRDLLRGAGDACFVSGPDGVIRAWNRAAEDLFGIRAAQAISKPCAAILQGRDAEGCQICSGDCAVREVAAQGQLIGSFDMEAATASGLRRWINVSIIVVTGPGGDKLLVHLCRDVEERKRLEEVTRRFLIQVGSLTSQQIEDLTSPPQPPHVRLTERECQILGLIARGRSAKEIAHELKISTATVRNHTQHILKKLCVHSRMEAVLRLSRESGSNP